MNHLLSTIQAWVAARYELDAEGERGATMVEYGLLVALIAVVVAVTATVLGNDIAGLFTDVSADITGP